VSEAVDLRPWNPEWPVADPIDFPKRTARTDRDRNMDPSDPPQMWVFDFLESSATDVLTRCPASSIQPADFGASVAQWQSS
jgi:hypothetical protein